MPAVSSKNREAVVTLLGDYSTLTRAHVQDEVLAGDLTLEPERIQLASRDVRAQLAAIRREGVAVASRQHPEPMTSVACPVTDQRHAAVAALSVVTPSGRPEPATVRPAVVAVARAISRAVAAAPGAWELP